MSQTVIFEIGAVIFVAVAAAVFLYGFMAFGSFQQPDDARALVLDDVEELPSTSTLNPGPRKVGVDRG